MLLYACMQDTNGLISYKVNAAVPKLKISSWHIKLFFFIFDLLVRNL